MAKSRRRGGSLTRKLLTWAALIITGTTLTRALVGEKGLVAVWRQRQEAASIERDIERLRRENSLLREEVRSLRTDPRSVESIAREELGYAKPGEIVILFPRQERRDPPPR